MELDLLSLPWEIQFTLAVGYFSYTLAYTGNRKHHNVTDIFFKSIIFSLLSLFIFSFENYLTLWGVVPAAILVPVGLAVFWSLFALSWYSSLLRRFGIMSDDSPSAWHSVSHEEKKFCTQVSVLLEDDVWLRCDQLPDFEKSPSGPVIFGPDGDIALYVTHIEKADGTVTELKNTIDEEYGDLITLIPSARIKKVNFRRKRKKKIG